MRWWGSEEVTTRAISEPKEVKAASRQLQSDVNMRRQSARTPCPPLISNE
jgi:hypothetical protein